MSRELLSLRLSHEQLPRRLSRVARFQPQAAPRGHGVSSVLAGSARVELPLAQSPHRISLHPFPLIKPGNNSIE